METWEILDIVCLVASSIVDDVSGPSGVASIVVQKQKANQNCTAQ